MYKTIKTSLKKTIGRLYGLDLSIELSPPSNHQFGDYTTNIAMQTSPILKKNPFLIAQNIVKNLPQTDLIEKVEALKPGFINFWISKDVLIKNLKKVVNNRKIENKNKHCVLIEFGQPNT
ncbi:MAG: hypothetical protein GXO93_07675, partial [FCB group bacterium]|nr:hypothetical protein [FCB group bacterium]